jgi:FMN phosphatase YigB (HAD superfamily)
VAVRAITFDYWNTIMFAVDPAGQWRSDAWQALLAEGGHVVETPVIREAFKAAWSMHRTAWVDNVQHPGTAFAAVAVDALGLDLDAPVRAQLVEAFMHEGDGRQFVPCPGVDDALRALRERGVHIGIVCDVGITPSTGLRRLLEHHGLLAYFDGWSFSDEVGWFKPAPAIFEHALGYLGTQPAQTAHIGDITRTDVAGALAMGMTAIRYRGIVDDQGRVDGADTGGADLEAHHVIDHHDELLGVLGLG